MDEQTFSTSVGVAPGACIEWSPVDEDVER